MSKDSLFIGLVILLSANAVLAKGPELSVRDYQLYMDWKDGAEDPRLAKYNPRIKFKKIARNLGVSTKVLQAAIDKSTPIAPTVAKDSETAIKDALSTTPVSGRILEIHVDAGQGHVVAGVKWTCGDARDVDVEAAFIAWSVADGGKVVKTLVVWCVNKQDTKLFSAKIGHDAISRISKSAIPRFARSRYIKMFEEVKRGPHK